MTTSTPQQAGDLGVTGIAASNIPAPHWHVYRIGRVFAPRIVRLAAPTPGLAGPTFADLESAVSFTSGAGLGLVLDDSVWTARDDSAEAAAERVWDRRIQQVTHAHAAAAPARNAHRGTAALPYWRVFYDKRSGYTVQFVRDDSWPNGAGVHFETLENAVMYASGIGFRVKIDPSVWEVETGA